MRPINIEKSTEMATIIKPSVKHYTQIDGLRFVAVFLVLIEHFASPIGLRITAGGYGVDLFFVISGFLITGILLNSKDSFSLAYRKFLGRRSLRIFPLYYLVVFVLFLLGYEPVRTALVYLLTYTYNYATVALNLPITNIYHFWSLCVEEQFYLFWPVLVLSLRRYPKAFNVLLIVLASFCYLQLCFKIVPGITPYNQIGLIPRGGSILLGAAGAVLLNKGWLKPTYFENIYLEVMVILVLCISLLVNYQIKFLVLGCCSLFFILKAVKQSFQLRSIHSFLNHKTVVYLGTISYGIYIFHLPISLYFMDYIFVPHIWDRIDFDSLGYFAKLKWNAWIFTFPILSLLSIILAGLSHKYIESPILKLKDRFF